MRKATAITTPPLICGRLTARLADGPADLRAAQALRHLAFRAAAASDVPVVAKSHAEALDSDEHDAACLHVLVEDTASATLVCCYRLLLLDSGGGLDLSYAARFYDLAPLHRFDAPMLEMGRFCIRPGWHHFDVLRAAWAFATGVVDARGVALLFGCSSFSGTRAEAFEDAFALLHDSYLGPAHWRPRPRAAEVYSLAQAAERTTDPRRARLDMPPLLRTYLRMGGWVGDHAVIDRDLGTMHVFTGLETRHVPEARARLLRGLLEQGRRRHATGPAA